MALLLPLLLLAAPPSDDDWRGRGVQVRTVGTASVTIIAAERIDAHTPPRRDSERKVQFRHRDKMPMTEYY